jgi:hypothetical protein
LSPLHILTAAKKENTKDRQGKRVKKEKSLKTKVKLMYENLWTDRKVGMLPK